MSSCSHSASLNRGPRTGGAVGAGRSTDSGPVSSGSSENSSAGTSSSSASRRSTASPRSISSGPSAAGGRVMAQAAKSSSVRASSWPWSAGLPCSIPRLRSSNRSAAAARAATNGRDNSTPAGTPSRAVAMQAAIRSRPSAPAATDASWRICTSRWASTRAVGSPGSTARARMLSLSCTSKERTSSRLAMRQAGVSAGAITALLRGVRRFPPGAPGRVAGCPVAGPWPAARCPGAGCPGPLT